MNCNITIEDVKRTVDKAKLKKECGIECIPNEALKSPHLLEVLLYLFKTCCEYGIIPSAWYKLTIKPVPKSLKNDPKIPFNYRGISLISTPYKMYSNILNRLTHYLEMGQYLVDEQKGFRKKPVWIDHIHIQ